MAGEAFVFTQADHDALLDHVFPERLSDSKRSELSLGNLTSYMKQSVADSIDEQKIQSYLKPFSHGRLGSARVSLDSETNIGGQMLLDHHRLLVVGHSSFSTVRANCCAFAGKWCYEVRLCTSGLLQIGWCTLRCSFSRENGVGDTLNSFAYDGSRVRKWNAKFATYGEQWTAHDVITCCIDCDEGAVTFHRNGNCLGVAFTGIPLGPGVAYFPALSLAQGEAVFFNFGDLPFAYPVPSGYRPLQAAPVRLEARVAPVLAHLERLIPIAADTRNDAAAAASASAAAATASPTATADAPGSNPGGRRSRDSTCWLIASHLVPLLEPGLRCEYIVAKHILPLMAKFSDIACLPQARQCHLEVIVQYFCSFLPRESCERVLTAIVSALFATYHCHPSLDYAHQRTCLVTLLALLRHDCARRFLISSVLFDAVEFPVLCHVNPLPERYFTKEPYIFEDSQRKKGGAPNATPTITWQLGPMARARVAEYKVAVSQVEDLVQEVLRTVMNHTDGSLAAFAEKLHEFVRDNMTPDTVNQQPAVLRDCCPQSAMPAFFHALARAIQAKWSGTPEMAYYDQQAYIPVEYFCLDELDAYEAQRLGGLPSYLAKTYKEEVAGVARAAADHHRRRGSPSGKSAAGSSSASSLSPSSSASGSASKRRVGALGALLFPSRGSGSKESPPTSPSQQQQQQQQSPGLASFLSSPLSATLSPSSAHQQPQHQLPLGPAMLAEFGGASAASATAHPSSCPTAEDNLFRFLPDFFVNATANAFYTLRDVCGLLVPFTTAPDSADLLLSFARFITAYFDDSRIVTSDTRELFLSNLVVLSCEPPFVEALQRLSQDEVTALVKSLLAPTSADSASSRLSFWFLTNRVLVRFWKGDGFAFRYAEEPEDPAEQAVGGDLLKQLAANRLFNTAPTPRSFDLEPYPSVFYQRQIRSLLLSDPALQRRVIDFLLNKLNLTFSDYLSVSQESRNQAASAAATASSRHAKVMSSFLDMTVVLVRTLELIAHLTPEFFVQPASSLFLSRLSQVVGQVLLRVSCTARQFPLLAGVCGLLRELALEGRQTVLASLKGEACLSSRALARVSSVLAAMPRSVVSEPELEFVRALGEDIDALAEDAELASCSEDDLCPICYAHRLSVVFRPCGHRSCSACIALQLNNKKECFFCKAVVKKVEDFAGNVVKL